MIEIKVAKELLIVAKLMQKEISKNGQKLIEMLRNLHKSYNIVKEPGNKHVFIYQAKKLIEHLEVSKIESPELKVVLQKANKALAEEDLRHLTIHLLGYGGVENILHEILKWKNINKEEDEYFGNVNKALKEFDKLGKSVPWV